MHTTTGNTVLITGGASGIGLALAERFLNNGNEVIICGRREAKLKEAKDKFPKLHTLVADVSNEVGRQALFDAATRDFPSINILVNNAGVQQRVNLLHPEQDWNYHQQELHSNLEAPIHLSMLFIPHLLKQQTSEIINVTSGLAIIPGTWVPVYSATKAALHSYTMSLRLQLADTNIRVVEILPPAVNTDLGGVGLHTFGAPLDAFADSVFQDYLGGQLEIGYGGTTDRMNASREEIDTFMKQSWNGFLSRNPDFK